TPDSIARARDIVREVAASLSVPLAEDAVLLTSEVVTNAIRHGGDRIELVAEADGDGRITVAVYDDGGAFQVGDLTPPPPEVPSGRGLQMVQRVARVWGVRDGSQGGKTVWFRLDDHARPDPPAGAAGNPRASDPE